MINEIFRRPSLCLVLRHLNKRILQAGGKLSLELRCIQRISENQLINSHV